MADNHIDLECQEDNVDVEKLISKPPTTRKKKFALFFGFIFLTAFTDMIVYNFSNKHFEVKKAQLVLKGDNFDAALRASANMKMTSLFHSYGVENGYCQLLYSDDEKTLRPVGDVHGTVNRMNDDTDEVMLSFELKNTEYSLLRRLLWDMYAGSSKSRAKVDCSAMGTVNIFHVLPVSFTVKPTFTLFGPNIMFFSDQFDMEDPEKERSIVKMMTNAFETLQESVKLETTSAQTVRFSLNKEFENFADMLPFPVRSFIVSLPELSYSLSTLESEENTHLLLSNSPSDIDLAYQVTPLLTTFSLRCAVGDGRNTENADKCTLVDSLHADKFYEDLKSGHLHMTATSNNPNFITGIIGENHYVSGHKYSPNAEAASESRTRQLSTMVSPRDPDVSDSGVDCIAVDGDNVYDSVLCLNVKKGFMMTYLDVYDEDGVMSVMQGVTSWALEGGVAFTTDVSASARGGYLASMNASASEDFKNASILFSYMDNGDEKIYTNVFAEWEVANGGKEADVHYFVQFNESFNTPGAFTTWGDFSYENNQYSLHANHDMDMNSAKYTMNLFGAGGYGGSWSNWYYTLEESSLIVDDSLQGSMTIALGAAIPASGKRGSIMLQTTILDDNLIEQQYTTNNFVWYSAENSWGKSGSIALDSTFRVINSVNWDTHDNFYYGDNMYMIELNNNNLEGYENFFAGGAGQYGGDFFNWYMTIDTSEARVNGNLEGSAIANLHSRLSDSGKSGDVKWYTKVRAADDTVLMMMDTDADWSVYDEAGIMVLYSKCIMKDVVNWDVEDYFEFGPFEGENVYYASMLNRDIDGSSLFDGYATGGYQFTPTYWYLSLDESGLTLNGNYEGVAYSLFEVQLANKKGDAGDAFFGVVVFDDKFEEQLYIDASPTWSFSSPSESGYLSLDSSCDLFDLSTFSWIISDELWYESNYYSLQLHNADRYGNERLGIGASGSYHGELTDWMFTIDQSELYLDEIYKGSASGNLVSKVPGNTGKIRLYLRALDDTDLQAMLTDSTVKWTSPDWISQGDVDFLSYMTANTCPDSCADIAWDIHDTFHYGNMSYIATMENKNINGEELVYALAIGQYGGGSYTKWWATLDDSDLRLKGVDKGQAVGHFTMHVSSASGLIDVYLNAVNDDDVQQGFVNTTAKWYSESSWVQWGDIEFNNNMFFVDPYSNTYLGCYFKVSDDNRGLETYMECPIPVCYGDTVTADLCREGAECHGDTYLRLFFNDTELTSNDDTCGLCSKVSYTFYSEPGCHELSLHQGCYDSSTCSGAPMITTPAKDDNEHPSYYFFLNSAYKFSYGNNAYLIRGSFYDQNKDEKLFGYVEGKYGASSWSKWQGTVDYATYRYEMEGPGEIKGELSVDLSDAGDIYFAMSTSTQDSDEIYLDTVNEVEWDGLTSLITASLYSETSVKSTPKFLMVSTLEIDDEEKRAEFFLVDVMGSTEQVNCTATAWYDVMTGMMTGIDMDFLWKRDLVFNAHMFLNAQTKSIENPTMLPSASPSSIPTSIPTKSPVTSRPTVAGETNMPTASPTWHPTYVPTFAPTSPPTVNPTAVPTSTPTVNPTAVPTTTPTLAPTSIPTFSPTVIPTRAPTMAPTPFVPLRTVISYDTSEVLDGISAAEFDQAATDAFLQVSADSMDGVSFEDLTFVSVSDVSASTSTNTPTFRQMASRRLAASASIVFTTKVILEDFGSAYADADALVESLQSQLAAAYSDPATAQSWVDMSVDKGSNTVTTSTTVALAVPTYGETQVTMVRTGAPTMAPTFDAHERGGSGDNGDKSTQTLTIALAVSGAVVLIGVILIAFFVKRHYEAKKPVEDIVISDNTAKGVARLNRRTTSGSSPGATVVLDDVVMARNPLAERNLSKETNRRNASAAGSLSDNEL